MIQKRVRFLVLAAVLCNISGLSWASSNVENPLFGFTHILPSPFTVPEGRLVFGTDIAYGLTDFFQVGTSLVRDIYKVYNANGKVALVDYPAFALGAMVEYEHFNYRDISKLNSDYSVNIWRPGLTTAYSILPRVALFIGASAAISNKDLHADTIQSSGYVQGKTGNAEISWAYNPPKKKAQIGNVLSAGISYDLDYKLMGVGLSHHWSGFQLGFHYYPSANFYKFQPIIAGGGSVDL